LPSSDRADKFRGGIDQSGGCVDYGWKRANEIRQVMYPARVCQNDDQDEEKYDTQQNKANHRTSLMLAWFTISATAITG
jgi:hypothetical protein